MRLLASTLLLALSALSLPAHAATTASATGRTGPAHTTLSGFKTAFAAAWGNGSNVGGSTQMSGIVYAALSSLGNVLSKPTTTSGGASLALSGVGGITIGTIGGTTQPTSGSLTISSATNTYTGSVVINSPLVYNTQTSGSTITAGSNLLLTGGSGVSLTSLTKAGAGTLVLGNSQTYTGTSTVAGTLNMGNVGTAGLGTIVLNTSNGVTYSAGTSNLTLQGGTMVSGASLQFFNFGSSGQATTVSNGSGLTISGGNVTTSTVTGSTSVLTISGAATQTNGTSTGNVILLNSGGLRTLSLSGGVINKR